jgi:hypothetical protein
VSEIDVILSNLKAGLFVIGAHAYRRMTQRGVTRDDIREVAFELIEWDRQDNGRYSIIGRDKDGDDLEVICVYDGQTVVVTVY